MITLSSRIFQLKWAVNEILLNASPADVGGIGPALRLVLTHRGLRDKFLGVTRELEEAGYRSIQVTDTGFRLLRNYDIRLDQNMGFEKMGKENMGWGPAMDLDYGVPEEGRDEAGDGVVGLEPADQPPSQQGAEEGTSKDIKNENYCCNIN